MRDAAIAEAKARQQAEQERLLAEEAIAVANRNLSLKQADIQAEIDAAQAKSAAAGPLAEAERQQVILAEQQKVAERNAELKERQLDTEVRKPADAERYRVEQDAQARKSAAIADAEAAREATIAAAQASAEQARLTGEGERSRRAALAEALEREGQARAAANAAEGNADAAVILAKGNAEAAAMQSKADAFGAYGEAAVLDLLLRVLPELVGAAAAPVGAIDKLTVISTDGASSLTKTVASTVAQGLQLGTDLTGVDLSQLLARLANRTVDGKPAAPAPRATVEPAE
jgi:flotillin